MNDIIQQNDRIFTKATFFDSKNNNWSLSVFGAGHKTAVCYGVVKKVCGNTATVLWDIDKKEMPININLLKKSSGKFHFDVQGGLNYNWEISAAY